MTPAFSAASKHSSVSLEDKKRLLTEDGLFGSNALEEELLVGWAEGSNDDSVEVRVSKSLVKGGHRLAVVLLGEVVQSLLVNIISIQQLGVGVVHNSSCSGLSHSANTANSKVDWSLQVGGRGVVLRIGVLGLSELLHSGLLASEC
eukprot:CAMPEP_0168572888 /NCGR_PEP_ID=MMETSP0413-20121227/18214_1 /TAXON_ID=136452 /ORGANISM="Filamoeba nolandi, Strain NC-AS-23-1" /LENGTH=145 /DNA_ID=CAMNT_0008606047 /DNA_START=60 /DNA_END=497 /DNA_ORIENTATION=+